MTTLPVRHNQWSFSVIEEIPQRSIPIQGLTLELCSFPAVRHATSSGRDQPLPSQTRTHPWEPKRVSKAGLSVEYVQETDELWSFRLLSPDGSVVHERGEYRGPGGVSQAVNTWIRDHWEPEQRKNRQQQLPALGPGTSALHRQMMAKADDNEAQAIRLREQADRLENESKRLRAAADVLGEDYG